MWELKSNLTKRAKVPELRAYCIPAPGNNSINDTFDNLFTENSKNKEGSVKYEFKLVSFGEK